jgi:hypothetical protein
VRSAPMSPKEYREFAAQCLRWAARAKSDEHKSLMLKLGHHWMQTAEKLERAAEPEAEAASVNASSQRCSGRNMQTRRKVE